MECIKTSDQIGDFPPTYRQKLPSDELREVFAEVSKNREDEKQGRKVREKLNWKLLKGLKEPI